jgi:hypothetical protein
MGNGHGVEWQCLLVTLTASERASFLVSDFRFSSIIGVYIWLLDEWPA